jgi:hypothetical protein
MNVKNQCERETTFVTMIIFTCHHLGHRRELRRQYSKKDTFLEDVIPA